MPYSHPQPIDRTSAIRQIWHLLPGALSFAIIAGYINTVALGFFQTPVSHMTGAISHLGVDLALGRFADAAASFSIVLGFALGALLAGVLLGAHDLMPGRRYGGVLFCEATLIGLSTWLILGGHKLGLPVVAMACGLQNAMTSSYCGLMIRSTHVTGTVTDIGVMLGHWLRHGQVAFWKLRFLSSMVLAFGLGGWIGATVNLRFGPVSLALPAIGCLAGGLVVYFSTGRGGPNFLSMVNPTTPETASFPSLQGNPPAGREN